MDFARKQLEKYGWTDGKGLGKHENGISEALKPKLKRSMTGIGHDAAADFTEHWWSALYDKAASNIEVKEKDGTTKKIKAKDDTGFEITNSTWKMNKKSKKSDKTQEQYQDFFVKTVVLGSGGMKTERVKESGSEDEEEKKDAIKMTDEELFAACGGRTAHKGARHGLKALGKLARIEQQEQLLLQQARFNGYSHAKKLKQAQKSDEDVVENANLLPDEENTQKRKKRIKKKHCLKEYSIMEEELGTDKRKKRDNEVETMEDEVENNCDMEIVKKGKKKKRYDNVKENEIEDRIMNSEDISTNSEKLKRISLQDSLIKEESNTDRSKKRVNEEVETVNDEVENYCNMEMVKKVKKKKRNVDIIEEKEIKDRIINSDKEVSTNPEKSKKRNHVDVLEIDTKKDVTSNQSPHKKNKKKKQKEV